MPPATRIGYQDPRCGPAPERGCGLVRSTRIEACKGGPDQYHGAPLVLRWRQWSCGCLVLTPGTQTRSRTAAIIGADGARTAASALSRRRQRQHEGRGTRRESADVSGTLVCDERADTQESDPAVDRAVLVFVGASVRAAGDAGGRPGRPRRRPLRARRQRDRRRRRRRLGTSHAGTSDSVFRRRPASSATTYSRAAVHKDVKRHPWP